MKVGSAVSRSRTPAKAARKPARRKAKKTFDYSWLLDRLLPPENPVLFLRCQQ